MVTGVLLVLAGFALPAPVQQAKGGPQRLDEFVPAFQFSETHSTLVLASARRTFEAIERVTASEIRLFRILTWVRSPRRPWSGEGETVLDPPATRPILDVALASDFILLAREPDTETVIGTLVVAPRARPDLDPKSFTNLDRQPGYAKAALNFRLEDMGDGWTRLTTETRVMATDPASLRRFRAYWRVIYPGSALIRRMWLRAIKKRAELLST